MESYLLSILKDTTEYIENNLLDDLYVDKISENVHVSKFHLLRIFKGATGCGLMEYVRRRRLAESLSILQHQNKSIEFIATKYSFGSIRTFNRTFKEEFKITPSMWRKTPIPLEILDKFNVDFMDIAGNGLMYYRGIKVLPTFKLAGYVHKINNSENQNTQIATKLGLDFFYHKRKTIINPVNENIYYGFTSVPHPYHGFTYYLPSLEIDENSIIPDEMKKKQVLTHKYGVFRYMGLHRPEELSTESLKGIWHYIFNVWMPTVDIKLDENFSFEYIDLSKSSKDYTECELYFPISKL